MSSLSQKLPSGLYAICDDGVRPDLSLAQKAELLVQGGVRVVQLRMKGTRNRDALDACRKISALCRLSGAVCLVDDRVDLALMSGAHGVHLGVDDLPVGSARELLGREGIVGVTVRNLEMVEAAHRAGADYVGLGPVFPTRTKRVNAPVLGLEAFAQIASKSPLPVIAISGISLSNIGLLASVGAYGAAVLSDLLEARDIPTRARALASAFASRSPA